MGIMKCKLGFLGFGNMACAIAGGIRKQGLIPAGDIGVFDIAQSANESATALHFTNFKTEIELVAACDFIFLCVKPQTFTDILMKIAPVVTQEKRFLTIAAGITMQAITQHLGDVAVIRAMPNTPLLLGCGCVALAHNEATTAKDFAFIRSVFESVGTVYELPETQFNEVINVNGSTPAYVYLFAKTIVDFAQESGIAYETALPMLCDTIKGSAEMLLHTGKTPEELIAMVTSKGGTTIAAIDTFAQTGFAESLRAGMQEAVKRAYALSLQQFDP